MRSPKDPQRIHKLVAMLALVGAPALAATGPRLPVEAQLPDSAWIMDHVRYLADPRCEGRGVGTQGIEIAAQYLEKEFRELGLEPAGDSTGYRQAVEVVTGVEVISPTDLSIGSDGPAHGVEREFQPLGMSASGEAQAPVAFAGYGITAPEYGYDDYAGLDVHNRFVLVLSQEPGEMDPHSRFDGDVNTAYSEVRTKAINAREHGALGLLLVSGPRYREEDELVKPRADAGYMSAGILAVQVKVEVADRLLEGSGWSLSRLQNFIDIHGVPKSMSLGDSLRLRVSLVKKRAYVYNVVGLYRGTATRDTAHTLVIGAHYDHLGFGSEHSLAPRDQGRIHFGADDNASGTGAMLSLARAWTSRPERPRHDLVFCAFAGEELGLLGSARYVSNPPRPMALTDAMINFDMVGRLREEKLIVMGTGTAVGIDSLVRQASARHHFDLHLTEDGYGPSDHSSFYKSRVPVLAFFTGAHADYHKPSDTWDKLNGAGLAEVAEFAYEISESLDARPPMTYRQAASDPQFRRLGGGSGLGAYLGTIPDYTQTEGGVKLSDVRDGSPAQAAGIAGGDVIVSFDGVRIDNIYDFTYALRTRRPGQKVVVGILRGGEKKSMTATLGKRGER